MTIKQAMASFATDPADVMMTDAERHAHEEDLKDVFDELAGRSASKMKAIGRAFKTFQNRIEDGLKLVRMDKGKHGVLWRVCPQGGKFNVIDLNSESEKMLKYEEEI